MLGQKYMEDLKRKCMKDFSKWTAYHQIFYYLNYVKSKIEFSKFFKYTNIDTIKGQINLIHFLQMHNLKRYFRQLLNFIKFVFNLENLNEKIAGNFLWEVNLAFYQKQSKFAIQLGKIFQGLCI